MSQRDRGASFLAWLDERLPVAKFLEDQLLKYYAPKNFNFLYFFGSLALLVLVNPVSYTHLTLPTIYSV